MTIAYSASWNGNKMTWDLLRLMKWVCFFLHFSREVLSGIFNVFSNVWFSHQQNGVDKDGVNGMCLLLFECWVVSVFCNFLVKSVILFLTEILDKGGIHGMSVFGVCLFSYEVTSCLGLIISLQISKFLFDRKLLFCFIYFQNSNSAWNS